MKQSQWFVNINDHVKNLNESKIFAGLMIIILNIASRYVNLKLSKNVELYLKHTFSKQILVFAIAWMGTRDIYVALMVTIGFIICVDYLFNEDSALCCLPEAFTEYHVDLDSKVTEADIKKAEETLQKARDQQGVDIVHN
jgi:hypothetical protein